jgi:hypothetical protein
MTTHPPRSHRIACERWSTNETDATTSRCHSLLAAQHTSDAGARSKLGSTGAGPGQSLVRQTELQHQPEGRSPPSTKAHHHFYSRKAGGLHRVACHGTKEEVRSDPLAGCRSGVPASGSLERPIRGRGPLSVQSPTTRSFLALESRKTPAPPHLWLESIGSVSKQLLHFQLFTFFGFPWGGELLL